jgi:hypothetical protein
MLLPVHVLYVEDFGKLDQQLRLELALKSPVRKQATGNMSITRPRMSSSLIFCLLALSAAAVAARSRYFPVLTNLCRNVQRFQGVKLGVNDFRGNFL